MREHVADGDGLAQVGKLLDVIPDVVVQREFSPLGQEQDGEGGKLFGRGADVVACVHRHRDAVRQVGHAVRPGELYLAIADDGRYRSGSSLTRVNAHQLIHLALGRGGFRLDPAELEFVEPGFFLKRGHLEAVDALGLRSEPEHLRTPAGTIERRYLLSR